MILPTSPNCAGCRKEDALTDPGKRRAAPVSSRWAQVSDPAAPGLDQGSIDWEAATFEGNRRRQMRRFIALSLAEKLDELEAMSEVVEWLGRRIDV